MIDEHSLQNLKLHARSRGQDMVGWLFLKPSYTFPRRTEIVLEGIENIPQDRTVIFAMNHTDRYNYWPFQYKMWDMGLPRYTTTWVKAKYYQNRIISWFFNQCNNIPLPSKGYLIYQDAFAVLDKKLSAREYVILRDVVEGRLAEETIRNTDSIAAMATKRRGDFDPDKETYKNYMARWNDRIMDLVEQRTLEAVGPNQNNLIVFPEGTRSLRLTPGKTGMVKFALRHGIDIVPVGSNGSEKVYPGASPWAKGGRIVYRIGSPLRMQHELASFQISEAYKPFSAAADTHSDKFAGAQAMVDQAINTLLDPAYQMSDEVDEKARTQGDRFV